MIPQSNIYIRFYGIAIIAPSCFFDSDSNWYVILLPKTNIIVAMNTPYTCFATKVTSYVNKIRESTYSTDKTAELARNAGAKVIQQPTQILLVIYLTIEPTQVVRDMVLIF